MKSIVYIIFFLLIGQLAVSQEPIPSDDITEGTLVIIDSMVIKGAKKVRERVIFGESRLKQGQSIPVEQLREELLASRQFLLNTRLFNDVEILIYKWTNDNHVSVEFVVDERWYIYPLPVVELTGISFREWRDEFDYDINRLTYGITVDHFNLTGNADVLSVDWRGGFQHQYRANYLITGIDKERNWGLGFGGNIVQNKGASIGAVGNLFDSELFDDFVFESQAASIGISRRKDINRRHGLNIGFQRIEIADTISELSPNFFENDVSVKSFGTVGYNAVLENRDLSEYPTDGEFAAGSLIYRGLFEDNISQIRFTGNVNYYEPLSEKFYFSSGLHVRYTPLYPDGFFTSATSRTAATQVPRGYADFQIFPVDYAFLKTELRYRILDKKFYKVPILPDRFKPLPLKIYPKVYFDAGRTNAADFDTENLLNDDFLYSFGAGVDFVSLYNTPLLIDVSRNHIGQTRLNFTVGKSF